MSLGRRTFVIGGHTTPFIGKKHPDFVWKGHPDFGKRDNPTIDDYVKMAIDGALAATRAHDNSVRIWQASDGLLLSTLRGHTSRINSGAFSADGSRFVTASDNGRAIIWDPRSGRQQKVLVGYLGFVRDARFSPDGRLLASFIARVASDFDRGEYTQARRHQRLSQEFVPVDRWQVHARTLSRMAPNYARAVTMLAAGKWFL